VNDGHPSQTPASQAALLLRLTGAATLAAGALLYGAGTSQPATLAAGTAGAILQANGAAAPSWTTALTLTALTVTGPPMFSRWQNDGSARSHIQFSRGAGTTTAAFNSIGDGADGIAALRLAIGVTDIATLFSGGGLAVGATAKLGSELVRFAAGSAPGTPGATDVLVGGGVLRTGGAVIAGDNSSVVEDVNAAATFHVINTNAGAAAYTRVYVQNNGASPRTLLDVYSSGYTGTLAGITLANWSFIGGSSGASSGLMIGHTNAKPIVFALATVEIARFTGGTIGTDSFAVKYTTASTSAITGAQTVAGGLGVAGRINAGSYITSTTTDAGTTNTVTACVLAHDSSATTGVGFGSQLIFDAKSSTTSGRTQARILTSWADATDASRRSSIIISAYDTSARNVIIGSTDGTAPMVGFLGAVAVVRQTLPAAATDAATTQALANSLRTALINLGLAA
jgi:hypothetical protein